MVAARFSGIGPILRMPGDVETPQYICLKTSLEMRIIENGGIASKMLEHALSEEC